MTIFRKTAFLLLVSWFLPTPSVSFTEKGAFCFSGKSSVSVYGKGHVPMKDLQVGDYVVTGERFTSIVPGLQNKGCASHVCLILLFRK